PVCASLRLRFLEKSLPARVPQFFERLDIALVDVGGIGKGGHGTVYARLAQQVQDGIGGTVAVVGDIVGVAAGEFELRMEAGDLDHALQSAALQQDIGFVEEEVKVEEVGEHLRHDQQGGVDLRRICVLQKTQLGGQFGEQVVRRLRRADDIADLPFHMHGLGERAEIE